MSVHTLIEKHRIDEAKKKEELEKMHREQLSQKFKDGFVLGTIVGSVIGTLAACIMNDND